MVLGTNNTTSTTRDLVYTLTSSAPIDCGTLSTNMGVDLDGTMVSSIDGVTAAANSLSCTINVTSQVRPAQFGTTTLTYTQNFSVVDLQGQAQSNVRLAQASVVLTVPPVASNLGGHSVTTTNGTIPSQLVNNTPAGLLPSAGAEARTAMAAAGIVAAPAGIPISNAMANLNGISSSQSVLNAMARAE